MAVPELGTGVTKVSRVPLEKAGTDAEAQGCTEGGLLTHREAKAVPTLGQTPKLSEYVPQYFAHYEEAKHEKRARHADL